MNQPRFDDLTPSWDECQQDDFKLWVACWHRDGGPEVFRFDVFLRNNYATCAAHKETSLLLLGVFKSPEFAWDFLNQIKKLGDPNLSRDEREQGEPKLWAACWSYYHGGPDVRRFDSLLHQNHKACFKGEECSWGLLAVFPVRESASHFLFNMAKHLPPEEAAS